MPSALAQVAKLEGVLEQELRSKLLSEIHRRELGVDELASALGIFPEAADSLMKRSSWTLETGVRVADALGELGYSVQHPRLLDPLVRWQAQHDVESFGFP